MFRLETRVVVAVSLILTWIVPIYLIIKYSTNYDELKQSDDKLSEKLDYLQLKVHSLEQQNENLQTLSNKPIDSLKKRDISSDFSKATINDHNRDTDVSQPHHTNKINIFIESIHDNIPSEKQFFKIFGTSGNEELFKYVKKLPEHKRKRILVTGGAGFVGSHLVDSLMLDGHEVIVCDNFFTGRKSNIDHWQGHANFELINHDVINPLTIEVNEIYHLASPASPQHYMSNPIKTIKTNTIGTINMLGLAKRVGARVLIASTSEIYGDPQVHPQAENYWGHVNPIGPRSCYDESKRLSESLSVAYNSRENVSIAIARIFNTYGPRMHPNDGRVVSNFIIQAISNVSITVFGSGEQTRSFQYVSDLVLGLKKLMESSITSPINLGNPKEMTVLSLATGIKSILFNSTSDISFSKLPIDDPQRRKPDITKATQLLTWKPIVTLETGLRRTVDYFSQELRAL